MKFATISTGRATSQPALVMEDRVYTLPYPDMHAVIAAPNARIIHAQQGAAVCEIAMSHWWLRRMAYAFSFPG